MYLNVGPWRYEVLISSKPLHNAKGEEVDGLAVDHQRILWLAESARGERRLEAFGHEAYHAFEYHFGCPKTAEDRANFHASVTAAIQQCLSRSGGGGGGVAGGLDSLKPEVDSPPQKHVECLSAAGVPGAVGVPGAMENPATQETDFPPFTPAPAVAPCARLFETDPSPFRGTGHRPQATMEPSAISPVRVIDERPWRAWLSRAKVRLPRNGNQRHTPLRSQIDGKDASAPPSMPWDNRCCARCERLISGGQIVNGPVTPTNLGLALERTLYCDTCHHLQRWIESAWPDGRPAGQCLQPEPDFVFGPDVETFLEEHPEARSGED